VWAGAVQVMADAMLIEPNEAAKMGSITFAAVVIRASQERIPCLLVRWQEGGTLKVR